MNRTQNLKKKNNLVYSRTEEERVPRKGTRVFFVLGVMVVLGVIYLTIFSDAFKVKEVRVNGYENKKIIEELAWEKIRENVFTENIIFFNKNNIQDVITGDLNIKEVKIKKILPNKVVIEISQTKPALIWVTAGDKYLIDDRGVAIGEAEEEEFPEVFDGINIKINPGERVTSPTFIKFIKDINSSFEAATATKIIKITIFDLMTDVHILSSNGWTVYLDASKSAEAQMENLRRVLAEAEKGKKKLEYIDMRLENRIYYK